MNSPEDSDVWSPGDMAGGAWSALNRAEAGPRFDAGLPRGGHSLQLYSQGTPNGRKVSIMLEELLEAGHRHAAYDAHLIDIKQGDQFSTGFVSANPNSKIPVLIDYSEESPATVFESGAILLYLAERFGELLPSERAARVEALNWLFWVHGAAPYIGGGFGHFYAYAPSKQQYPIDRYAMETKRLFDVLDRRLSEAEYLSGRDYSIADIAAYPWFAAMQVENMYNATRFLELENYEHVSRWVRQVGARDAVRRGNTVKGSRALDTEVEAAVRKRTHLGRTLVRMPSAEGSFVCDGDTCSISQ